MTHPSAGPLPGHEPPPLRRAAPPTAGWGAPPPAGWLSQAGPAGPAIPAAGPPRVPAPGPAGPGTPAPGFAGPGTPGGAAGAAAVPVHRGAVATFRVVGLLATPLGLSIPFSTACLWVVASAWAAFATLAALVQAAPLLAGSFGWDEVRAWTVGAAGTAALVLFWVLVALPDVGSNTGFTLTLGAAAAAAATLLAPGRRW